MTELGFAPTDQMGVEEGVGAHYTAVCLVPDLLLGRLFICQAMLSCWGSDICVRPPSGGAPEVCSQSDIFIPGVPEAEDPSPLQPCQPEPEAMETMRGLGVHKDQVPF